MSKQQREMRQWSTQTNPWKGLIYGQLGMNAEECPRNKQLKNTSNVSKKLLKIKEISKTQAIARLIAWDQEHVLAVEVVTMVVRKKLSKNKRKKFGNLEGLVANAKLKLHLRCQIVAMGKRIDSKISYQKIF